MKHGKWILLILQGEAIFKQKVKVLADDEFTLKGNINFMVCKDGACLPPEDAPFEITITP